MLKTQNIEVFNLRGALRGMRNPMASWHLADSLFDETNGSLINLGANDRKLALKLVTAGRDHSKFLRQIFISMDITAPDYWWKEMDTYKVATVSNSTSTMHKLTSKPLTAADFSWDETTPFRTKLLDHLNELIAVYKDLMEKKQTGPAKNCWRELIQDLPMSYNYTRTWTGNYENLRNIYHARRNHNLAEWHTFCDTIAALPCGELITIGSSTAEVHS